MEEWGSPDGPAWLVPVLEHLNSSDTEDDRSANANPTDTSPTQEAKARSWLTRRKLKASVGLELVREAARQLARRVAREQIFYRLLFHGCARGHYTLLGLTHCGSTQRVGYEEVPRIYLMRNPNFTPGKGVYGHGQLSSAPRTDDDLADPNPVYLSVKISRTDASDLAYAFDTEESALAREELFERIKTCEITPQEGEAEAKQRGLEPLNPKPGLSQFDPSKLDDWTFVMAIAWIASGDLNVVREYWEEYRKELYAWMPQVQSDGALV
jgi:hypothetical protein